MTLHFTFLLLYYSLNYNYYSYHKVVISILLRVSIAAMKNHDQNNLGMFIWVPNTVTWGSFCVLNSHALFLPTGPTEHPVTNK